MKVKDAVKITGSMTRTKKMPGLSYSLPAWECITGAKLRKVPGSVCAGCYALKGNLPSIAPSENECADLYLEWHTIDGPISGAGLGDNIGVDDEEEDDFAKKD